MAQEHHPRGYQQELGIEMNGEVVGWFASVVLNQVLNSKRKLALESSMIQPIARCVSPNDPAPSCIVYVSL